MRLLHVDSSVLGANSVSRALSAEVVASERARSPGLTVTYRDLVVDPLQHLSGAHVAVLRAGTEVPAALRDDVDQSRAAMDEFLSADVVVIGAPMYNFSVPSQLKAWIDRLAIPGKTFKYDSTGVVGLAGGKRVVVASSRGGMYGAATPMASLDHQETYLRSVFGFFGITDLTFIRAEGLAVSDRRPQSMAAARAAIAALPAVA